MEELQKRIRFQELSELSMADCIEDKVMLVDRLERLCFNGSMELDFIALLFCTQGNIGLDIGERHYRLEAGDVLYCNKGTRLSHILPQTGYRGKLLCVAWQYAEELFLRGTCQWESVLHIRQNPQLHLNGREQELLKAYYQLFTVKVENYFYTPQDDVDYIFRGFFHDFRQILDRHTEASAAEGEKGVASSRQDMLFKQFITLLRENYTREHFLNFYADRLCVTPKYLSTVVRMVSGQSVSKWIDVYLMDEIRSLLKNSNLTIAEIADRLHFSNHSFFGKFVKAQTGESPARLRRKLRG